MRLKSSKINEVRRWGLLLTLGGMGVMLLGTAAVLIWGESGKIALYFFAIIGMFLMLGSVGVYFWAGMMSTSAVTLDCPECGKRTKILGKTDRCMFCRTILTLDESYAQASETNS